MTHSKTHIGLCRGAACRALLLIAILSLVINPTVNPTFAASDDAHLTASSLSMQQTDTGAILTLAGPVEVTYQGNRLTADSAEATLKSGAASLTDALVSIELTGHVQFTGADGATATASSATFQGPDHMLSLRGSSSLSKGAFSASAGSVDYDFMAHKLNASGGVKLSKDKITAQGDSAEYDLTSQEGTLSGSVIVKYKLGKALFGSDPIDEVVLKAPTLSVNNALGNVWTPTGEGRTTLDAGGYTLAADSLHFVGSGIGGNAAITGSGNVQLEGKQGNMTADNASFSTADRIFKADGHVTFSILGQEGTADSIEVNLASGWSVKITGGTVGGGLDQSH